MQDASASLNRVQFALRYYRRLERAERYVHEHLHQSLTLVEVSEFVGLSPSRFSHLFHEKTGICFRDWLRHLRVQRAQELLRRHDLPIAEVARAVGFRDIRSLERAFRKLLDQTPRQFRDAVVAGAR